MGAAGERRKINKLNKRTLKLLTQESNPTLPYQQLCFFGGVGVKKETPTNSVKV
jgi:hypothetical protein